MSNNRGLKNRVAISNAIDREIYEKLKSYSDDTGDRKSTRLNSSHRCTSRMPSSA